MQLAQKLYSFALNKRTKDVLLFQVAGAMGVMCIVSGLIYLADFFYVLCQRTALLQQY